MLTIDIKVFNPVEGERILDVGCGEGRHTFAMYRLGCEVFALDKDRDPLLKTLYVLREMERKGEGKGKAMVLRGNGLLLPFRDKSFDKIICAEVMEHIPQDREAAKELVRVLKPGGIMAVTVPTPFTEKVYGWLSWDYFNTPGGHIRIYSPSRLAELLTGCGLEIMRVGFAHSFHSLYWVLRCLSGLHNDRARIPRIYHRFLHQVVLHPKLQRFEYSCNYFFPKSMVLYCKRSH